MLKCRIDFRAAARHLAQMLRFFILFCWLFSLFFSAPSHAGFTHTQSKTGGGLEEIILKSDEAPKIERSFVLPSPPRLVIDITRQSHGNGVALPKDYRGMLIKSLRFGQFDAATSRIVLDLAATQLAYQLSAQGNTLRITLKSSDASPAPKARAKPAAAQGTPVAFPVPAAKPEAAAQQAAKPIVVIDAGHGGKDSGALGRSGVIEKRITLDYAKALRTALLKTGRYRVAMTRSDDRYLFLKERIAIARKMQGDVFISIHADSNPRRDARGLSVYTLSEKASDDEAAALARQENKADIIGGMDLSVEDAAVANILIDLAQRETNNKSFRLAEHLVDAAKGNVALITKPHRQAGFRVLKSPDMPSMLVEVGFLSNREDEKRLQSNTYRDKVAQLTITALDRFFADQ